MSDARKSTNFKSFYSENREAVWEEERDKKFKELMRAGKSSMIVDWNKMIYGAFGLAFLAKGLRLLYRE